MELTVNQTDGLTELINIGYGRAAGALSELTGYRVSLEVPQVAIHPIETIGPMLQNILGPSVVSVDQVFAGPVSGNGILMLDEASAIVLSNLLSDEKLGINEFNLNAREVITEAGNILLNACLGVFGNLLKIHVHFSVPKLRVENITELIKVVSENAPEKLEYALMIHTRFHVRTGDVTGYLVIVLGIASLDRLVHELDDWEIRQSQ